MVKILRELRRRLRAEGLDRHTVEIGPQGHYVVRSPDGVIRFTCAVTPSDRRAEGHVKRDVRREAQRWRLSGKPCSGSSA